MVWRNAFVAVAVSYILSRLMLGNFLFTIPLMVLSPSLPSRRKALLPVAAVTLLILVTELLRSRPALDDPAGRILLLIGLFIPIVLLVASAVWIVLGSQRTIVRYLASCLFGVAVSMVMVFWFSRPDENLARVDSAMYETFRLVLGQVGTNGQNSSAFSTEELKGLYRMAVMAIGAFLAPLTMALVGLTSFVAMSYQARYDRTFSERVSHWQVPGLNLWVFLGSWSVVLLLMFLDASYVYRALALQVALGSSVLYAVGGMAIIVHFVLRKGIAVNTGKLIVTVFLLAFLVPGVNILVVFVLPLLGVTETWIEYRKL